MFVGAAVTTHSGKGGTDNGLAVDLVSDTPYDRRVGNKYLNPNCEGTVMFGDLQKRAGDGKRCMYSHTPVSKYVVPPQVCTWWEFSWECGEHWGDVPSYSRDDFCTKCGGGPVAFTHYGEEYAWAYCKSYVAP